MIRVRGGETFGRWVGGLCVLATLSFFGCARTETPRSKPADAWSTESPAEAERWDEIANSGETLNGTFELATQGSPGVAARYVFTEEGGFARTIPSSGDKAPLTQSGTYLLDTSGRLFLYVERSGESAYAVAELEVVTFGRGEGDSISLGANGESATYRRVTSPPLPGSDRPTVE